MQEVVRMGILEGFSSEMVPNMASICFFNFYFFE